MSRPLRIALLTHSTNPRGGVVHALALGDALAGLGHDVTVHAPDPLRNGFFRATRCATVSVEAFPFRGETAGMVEVRISDYLKHFARESSRGFDVYHAGDGISGNALARLKKAGKIRGFARTVHHLDAFADPLIGALQDRSIEPADELFVVSEMWRDEIKARYGRTSTLVANGVDRNRFRAVEDARSSALKERLGLGEGPVFLSVGGVEGRKNSLRTLEAFIEVRRIRSDAQLVIAGGASLLDHHDYQRRFDARRRDAKLPESVVILTGPLPDADMPILYRLADTLVFPSLKEGFGLCVLEAMASGIPVVVSSIRPFIEYLGQADAIWCDPASPSNIAGAMLTSLAKPLRDQLIQRGFAVAARHDWRTAAHLHIAAYSRLQEAANA